ncbi:hypothetical protein D9M68_821900 [compost metagenome]
MQVGVTDAGQQQGAQPGVVAELVLLMLPLQRDDPLPATVQLAVPLRPHRQQAAEAVGVGQFLILVTAGVAQLVGQGGIAGHVVPQADVLSRRRQLHLGAVTVALRIGPMARPVGPTTGADIGGITQAQPHAAGLARLQPDFDRNPLLLGGTRVGVDAHRLEITAGTQRLVQLGDQLGVVGRVGS